MLELILRILDFSLSILKPILVDVTLITVVRFESAAGCEKAALGHLKIPAHPIVSTFSSGFHFFSGPLCFSIQSMESKYRYGRESYSLWLEQLLRSPS